MLKYLLVLVAGAILCGPAHADDARFAYKTLANYYTSPLIVTPVCGVDASGVPQVCSQSGGGSGGSSGGSSTGTSSNPTYVTGSVTPAMTGGVNLSVSAAATYVAFGSQTCRQMTIANNSGVTINVQQGGSGAALPVFANTYYTLFGLSDASSIAVERADGVATAVAVNARCEY